jgi:hypothetical protein
MTSLALKLYKLGVEAALEKLNKPTMLMTKICAEIEGFHRALFDVSLIFYYIIDIY